MPDINVQELIANIPVVLSLILIEGLLSVDNSLAIAALARRLPEADRPRALTWGMAGAYGFRCICLLFATFILHNRWLKLAGAVYLIYLMCKELTDKDKHESQEDEQAAINETGKVSAPRSFFSVVSGILVLDASLSVDNVVAAVAMTPKIWVVYLGVGIGILTLRLVANYAIKLIGKFPILEAAAFLLVGFVGVLLIVEMEADMHFSPLVKFAGIVVILAISLAYEEVKVVNLLFKPLVIVFEPVFRAFAFVVGIILWPITKGAHALAGALKREPSKAS